ncbi:PREDICTED: uncharacterized protein LOC105130572 [Populus euphratica]|uniref:Uncharacterized protein LOC105130572 n=1 Tax=Populus euphratica TaxID=75702 RepID=A0AAJ6UKJ9_POPEU|nr:PREDICTED: uncharacterized protein LOC105130572 [Populus euphratica]
MKMPTSVLSVVSLGIFLVSVSSHEGTQDEHNLVQETPSGLLNNGTGRARQSKCSHRDIVIAQAQVQSQPSGLPTFLVEITNTNTKVQVSNIHFYCEQFSSAIVIRPDVFKRIAVNDSLVNGGKTLAPGLTLSFTYAYSFKYPLSVNTIKC